MIGNPDYGKQRNDIQPPPFPIEEFRIEKVNVEVENTDMVKHADNKESCRQANIMPVSPKDDWQSE